MAQLFKFHEWPSKGNGNKNYVEGGELGASLAADFTQQYEWSAMQNEYNGEENAAGMAEYAVARLMADMAVIAETSFGFDASSTNSTAGYESWSQYLRYETPKFGCNKKGYVGETTTEELYGRIKADIQAGRPAIIGFSGHSFIVDGLAQYNGKDYYHFNYGWGGSDDGWYLLTSGVENDGVDTVVESAITSIVPKPIPVFREMNLCQGSSFTLNWDFPKTLTVEAFRLSMRSRSTRAIIKVVADEIPGTTRSYSVTGQVPGDYEYLMEAKVNGSWQAVSDPIPVVVSATTPTMFQASLNTTNLSGLFNSPASLTITANAAIASVEVTTSRPDLYPMQNISVSGSGSSRVVKFTQAQNWASNAQVWLVVTDTEGNSVKLNATLSYSALEDLLWHPTFEEAQALAKKEGKLVLMVVGRDTCYNTNTTRFTVCETPEVKAKLLENFILWYENCDTPKSQVNYWNFYTGSDYTLPFVSIIDPTGEGSLVRGYNYLKSAAEFLAFLDFDVIDFSLEDGACFEIGTVQKLKVSCLNSNYLLTYTMDGSTPTVGSTPVNGDIALHMDSEDIIVKVAKFLNGARQGDIITRIYHAQEKVARPVCLQGTDISYPSGTPLSVQLTCPTEGAVMHYSTDGYYPDESYPIVEGPLEFTGNGMFAVYAVKADCIASEYLVISYNSYEVTSFASASEVVTDGTFTFTTGGDKDWILDRQNYISSPSSLKSGAIADSQKSIMNTTVTGPGKLSFKWKVSSESNYDTLTWMIDLIPEETISGKHEWQTVTKILEEGTHTISWIYSKDRSDKGGDDCGWVDDISWMELEDESDWSWELNDDGNAVITGYNGDEANLVLPASVYGESIPVVAIGESAFFENTELLSVVIPEGVKEIGSEAFAFCANLQDITLPAGLVVIDYDAFWACEALTDVVLPNELEYIGDFAFGGCNSLTSIDIPSSVEWIGDWAFDECISLEEILVDEDNELYASNNGILFDKAMETLIQYPAGKKEKQYIVPSSVTQIGEYAFDMVEALEYVTLPEKLEGIGHGAFMYCYSLESITIPSGIKEIADFAFAYCENLARTDLTEGVEKIGECAFAGTGLQVISFPASLQNVNEDAFEETFLSKVYAHGAPSDVYRFFGDSHPTIIADRGQGWEEYLESGFNGCPVYLADLRDGDFMYELDSDGNAVIIGYDGKNRDVVIPSFLSEGSKVVAIDDWAFSGYDMKSVEIPASVVEIGEGAFDECASLEEIAVDKGNAFYVSQDGVLFDKTMKTLIQYPANKPETDYDVPSSVVVIGDYAFDMACNLANVKLPEGLESIGCGAFEGCVSLESIAIPSGVKEINEYAFANCENLTNLKLSEKLESIGWGAFMNCDSLESITIPSGVKKITEYTFAKCGSLASVYLTEGVETIGECAFAESGLREISFPASLQSIDRFAFESTILLTVYAHGAPSDVYYSLGEGEPKFFKDPKSGNEFYYIPVIIADRGLGWEEYLESGFNGWDVLLADLRDGDFMYELDSDGNAVIIGYDGKETDIVIPATVTKESIPVVAIGDEAFYEDYKLTSVEIPEGVTTIGYSAFDSCSSLTSVSMPESLEKIEDYAFWHCSSLVAIVIPSGIKEVCEGTFSKCTALVSVELPEGLETIGCDAFYKCTSLTSIEIPSTVTTLGDEAFSNCQSLEEFVVAAGNPCFVEKDGVLFDKTMETLLVYPAGRTAKNYIVPASVKTMGSSAFEGCSSLVSVTLPEGLEDIVEYAFYECTSLRSMDIPASVKHICWEAFYGCSSLVSVTLREGLESLKDCAFEACPSLRSVVIPASVNLIGQLAFLKCDSLAFYRFVGGPPAECEYLGDNGVVLAYPDMGWEPYVGSGFGRRPVLIGEHFVFQNGVPMTGCETGDSVSVRQPRCEGFKGWSSMDMELDSAQRFANPLVFDMPSHDVELAFDCDVEYTPDDEFEYELDENGEAVITSYVGTRWNVVVPPAIGEGNWPVVAIGCEAFACREELEEVILPEGLKAIGEYAFSECFYLAVCKIPSSVEYIGEEAFEDTALTRVEIPAAVTAIGNRAFDECEYLTEILVAEDNASYAALDGVLFNKEKTALLCYPSGKIMERYVIPEGVVELGDYAFEEVDSLQEVVLPTGLTNIARYNFSDCDKLLMLTIPDSVVSLEDGVFGDNYNMLGILFEGRPPMLESDFYMDNVASVFAYPNLGWEEYVLEGFMGRPVWIVTEKPPVISRLDGKEGGSFVDDPVMLRIENDDKDCVVRYTLDGTMPYYDSPVADGDIELAQSAVIVAACFTADGDLCSAYSVREFTKQNSLSAPDDCNVTFTTYSESPWSVVNDAAPEGGKCLVSGKIIEEYEDEGGVSTLEARVSGTGVLSFWWKVSCEWECSSLRFSIDGVTRLISGEQEWQKVVIPVEGSGEHLLKWNYVKDDSCTDGKDCGWVAKVQWQTATAASRRVSLDGEVVGLYKAGETVTVAAPTVDGEHFFAGWKADGIVLEDASATPLRFVMPDKDVSLEAIVRAKAVIVFNLSSGWNLVTVPAELDGERNESWLAELQPMTLDRRTAAYSQVMSTPAPGTALWIYIKDNETSLKMVCKMDVPDGEMPELSDGWNVLGIVGRYPVQLPKAEEHEVWKWSNDCWNRHSSNELYPGTGYMIRRSK